MEDKNIAPEPDQAIRAIPSQASWALCGCVGVLDGLSSSISSPLGRRVDRPRPGDAHAGTSAVSSIAKARAPSKCSSQRTR
jgi:hypothetical protein